MHAHVQHQRAALPIDVTPFQSTLDSLTISASATAYSASERRIMFRVRLSPTSPANHRDARNTIATSAAPKVVHRREFARIGFSTRRMDDNFDFQPALAASLCVTNSAVGICESITIRGRKG